MAIRWLINFNCESLLKYDSYVVMEYHGIENKLIDRDGKNDEYVQEAGCTMTYGVTNAGSIIPGTPEMSNEDAVLIQFNKTGANGLYQGGCIAC